jgi:hypothetical protein
MSPPSENMSANGISARPPARFWIPLPIQRLAFGASTLNKMVPPTIDAKAAKSQGQQDQWRAIGDADLAGDKAETPKPAEQADINRQRIEFGTRRESDGTSDMGISSRPRCTLTA